MAAESVIKNIHEARNRTTAERSKAMSARDQALELLNSATVNFSDAERRRDQCAAAERLATAELRKLTDYCATLDKCPEALREQIQCLEGQASEVSGHRSAADAAVSRAKTLVDQRQAAFAIADETFQKFDRQIRELDTHIASLN